MRYKCVQYVYEGELLGQKCDYCDHNNVLHPGANDIQYCLGCELEAAIEKLEDINDE